MDSKSLINTVLVFWKENLTWSEYFHLIFSAKQCVSVLSMRGQPRQEISAVSNSRFTPLFSHTPHRTVAENVVKHTSRLLQASSGQ